QNDRGIQVSKGGGGGGVSQVIRRYVYRLDRSNGPGFGGSNSLLQDAHFLCQRWLVTHRRRHTTQQCRNFGTRQCVSIDIVDKQQYVLAFIAEFLCHGQTCQCNTQTVTRRFVHLTIDHRHFGIAELLYVNNTGFLHLVVEVVTFPGSLTHASEYRQTGVLGSDVVNQFHHVDRLAHTGTAEQADFTTFGKRTDKIDNLDPGFQQLFRGREFIVGRCRTVNCRGFFGADRTFFVDWITQNVHDTAQGFGTNRHTHGRVGVLHHQTTAQTFGR